MKTCLLVDSLPKRRLTGLGVVDCGQLAPLKGARVHDVQTVYLTRKILLLVDRAPYSASSDLGWCPVGEVTLAFG